MVDTDQRVLLTTNICYLYFVFFFFNDTATTEIYTLSLHDALPIYKKVNAKIKIIPIFISFTEIKPDANTLKGPTLSSLSVPER